MSNIKGFVVSGETLKYDFESLDNNTAVVRSNIADEYSSSSTYAVGDYCWYEGSLYRCATAISTAEEWTAAHWTAVALGDEIKDLKNDVLGDEIKQALLACLSHVAWADDHGSDYVDALEAELFGNVWKITTNLIHCTKTNARTSIAKNAAYSSTITAEPGYTLSGAAITVSMGGVDITSTAYSNGAVSIPAVIGELTISISAVPVTISSISSVFNQGQTTIYETDSLTSLKQYLTVTALYSDGSTATIASADYSLSGTLSEGDSTITVTYQNKTATFVVVVTATPNTDVVMTESQVAYVSVYSDDGSTLIRDGSSRCWMSDDTFSEDTVVDITVLYGTLNQNLKQYAGSWDGTGDGTNGTPYKVYYAETIGYAQESEYTSRYTVKAGSKLFIRNYNAGTPQSITVKEVL